MKKFKFFQISNGERNYLLHLFLFVGITTILLLFSGYFVYHTLNRMEIDSTKQLLRETETQYSSRITMQITNNVQALKTLAVFIGEDTTYSTDDLAKILKEENKYTQFAHMGLFDCNGKGFFINMNTSKLKSLSIRNQDFFDKAKKGEVVIASPNTDFLKEGTLYYYAVPIYHADKLSGILLACDTEERLSNLLSSDNANTSTQNYFHILDSNGQVVVRGENKIFDSSSPIERNNQIEFEKTLQKDLLKCLQVKKEFFSTYILNDKKYWVNTMPLNINDWNLFYAVPYKKLNENFSYLVRAACIFIIIIIALFVFLLRNIYHVIQNRKYSIYQLAYYDPLTGSYNKNKFQEKSMQLLSENTDYSLILLNIRRFQFINELFGYEKGDELLCHIANTLHRNLNANELFYRDTADNFGLLLHTQNKEIITKRLRSIIEQIEDCPLKKEQCYKIICYFGIKILEAYSHSVNFNVFTDRALVALKEAKVGHESTFVFFNDAMFAQETTRHLIESNMHFALSNQEFKAFLQPKFDLKTGILHSAEALVRWIRPDGSMVYPDQFIPLFEKNGFSAKLDIYMVEIICRTLRTWIDTGYPVVPISVNQSRILFYHPNYIHELQSIIEKYQIDPSLIILEITEGTAFDNTSEMNEIIIQLHQLGFEVSMDDFGSGYSSFNTLKDFPIDELKLDRVFLSDSGDVKKRNWILKSLISLAKELKIQTVMEGIETKEQAIFMKSIGCTIGQGYYFSRPISLEEFEQTFFKQQPPTFLSES